MDWLRFRTSLTGWRLSLSIGLLAAGYMFVFAEWIPASRSWAAGGAVGHFPGSSSIHGSPLGAEPQTEPIQASICVIQGRFFTSPFENQIVTTQGIVYASRRSAGRRGLFLQADGCDQNPNTSDGLFVYLGVQPSAGPGDFVEVTGIVQEYYGRTEIVATPEDIRTLSKENPLPAPVKLEPPRDYEASRAYFERLEGMVVKLDEAVVLSPTDEAGETWIAPGLFNVQRIFFDDPSGTGGILCLPGDGEFKVEPQAKVGDRLYRLAGAMDYVDGAYRLALLSQPDLVPGGMPNTGQIPAPPGFTAATLNLGGLFDASDDASRKDQVLSPGEYRRRLEKRARLIHRIGEPDLLAVQEVENQEALQALVSRPEIDAEYGYALVDGPDERGLDVALMYRKDRVQVMETASIQGCTTLVDGLGPDGNGDVDHPQNAQTCDPDGSGSLSGNRLFSRPPLVVKLRLSAPEHPGESVIELWLVVNHWKSKVEDSLAVPYTLPRRLQEAGFVAGLVRKLPPEANLVVLGDLNDTPGSQPLATLFATGMRDVWLFTAPQERYSYIYRGLSQALDYIFVRFYTPLTVTGALPLHLNADFPAVYSGVNDTYYRSSDHDPLLVQLNVMDHWVYLPGVLTFPH